MVGEYDGRIAAAGNRELMIDVGVEFNDELQARIEAATNKGYPLLLVCLGQRLLGWIEFSDLVRDTSAIAVKRANTNGN